MLLNADDQQAVSVRAMGPDDWPTVRAIAENSVYIDPGHRGRGVGRRLLTALVSDAEAAGFWTIQTGIFPENTTSLALHEACGFRTVGIRERLGQLAGIWRDVVFLEHRRTRD